VSIFRFFQHRHKTFNKNSCGTFQIFALGVNFKQEVFVYLQRLKKEKRISLLGNEICATKCCCIETLKLGN
jgi:hypothetical protein